MFIHSLKVPRLYKVASNILKEVKEKGISVKQLLYAQKKHRNYKAIYALVVNTLEHFSEIEYLLEKSQLLVKEARFDPWIARILITELLWTKKQLNGSSKPIETILSYRGVLEEFKSGLDFTNKESTKKVKKPRFVRINTLAITLEDAINGFRGEGRKLVHFDKEDYEEFISKCGSLENDEFMIDIHVKELLLFPHNAQFYNHSAYKSNWIMLQDKASCLPVHLLNPPPKSVVLDMCAAPGMKTTYLAALLQNKGTIYAIEKDTQRFITLNKIINDVRATCVKTMNNDVLEITSKHCPDVEYILVDPSCTGSGMTERITVDGKYEEPNLARLQKLSGFQVMILKHALRSFHKAKRVVYSTCSIHSQENEYVVNEVLKCNFNFKLVSAKHLLNGPWKKSMSLDNCDSVMENCIFTKPNEDLTNGFFIAVFERTVSNNKRKHSQSENDQNSNKLEKGVSTITHPKNKKRKKIKGVSDTINNHVENNTVDADENRSTEKPQTFNDDNEVQLKKRESKMKKKARKHKVNELDELTTHEATTFIITKQENSGSSVQLKESKKNKKAIKNNIHSYNTSTIEEFDIKTTGVKQKKVEVSEKVQEILTQTNDEPRLKKCKKSKRTHKENINDNSNLEEHIKYNSEVKKTNNFNTIPANTNEAKKDKESKRINKFDKTNADEDSISQEIVEVLTKDRGKKNHKKHKENVESENKTKTQSEKLVNTSQILISEIRKKKKKAVEEIESERCSKNEKQRNLNINIEDKDTESEELHIKKSKKLKKTARNERGNETHNKIEESMGDDYPSIIFMSKTKIQTDQLIDNTNQIVVSEKKKKKKKTVEEIASENYSMNNEKERDLKINIDENYENTGSEELHVKKSKKHKKAARNERGNETHNKIDESMGDDCPSIFMSKTKTQIDQLIDYINQIVVSEKKKKKTVEEIASENYSWNEKERDLKINIDENYENTGSEELHVKKSKNHKKAARNERGNETHSKIDESMGDDYPSIIFMNKTKTQTDQLIDNTNQIVVSEKKKKKKTVEETASENYSRNNEKERDLKINIDENYENTESEELHVKKSKKHKKAGKGEEGNETYNKM